MSQARHEAAARGLLPEPSAELLEQLINGPATPAEVQDLTQAFPPGSPYGELG
ncbi:hypothetical protein [Burkholderia ambifaria]|uniref:hypothetical protein n=1 Tax=Burkholderia ambifaria TaxID=152480 RepID=UPI000A7A9A13|nr:hypothetical protein [Burkholderia ambifaria]MBR7932594.1 hypothetical protein [Burkholderia ambifaria]WDS24124.1 hypothetical protein OR983_04290 [Burkholderia ambifaria]